MSTRPVYITDTRLIGKPASVVTLDGKNIFCGTSISHLTSKLTSRYVFGAIGTLTENKFGLGELPKMTFAFNLISTGRQQVIVGCALGCPVGCTDGCLEGRDDGCTVGHPEGCVGLAEGRLDGLIDGCPDGRLDGWPVGCLLGSPVG